MILFVFLLLFCCLQPNPSVDYTQITMRQLHTTKEQEVDPSFSVHEKLLSELAAMVAPEGSAFSLSSTANLTTLLEKVDATFP